MKILVVGGGGREHAVIRKLKQNPNVTDIFCAPGNGGISRDAACVPIKATDIETMLGFALSEKIDFAVITPDDPLVLGMADEFRKHGIPCFGPSKDAARIEGSKVFSKNLMKKYGIPTADYQTFSSEDEAVEYISKGSFPIVIKADGLALGKGVIIAENLEDAKAAVHSIMSDKIFGASGNNIVVEEFLTGPEISALTFCDGKCVKPMVSSMDHKRVFDDNRGPNTGGMGVVAPNPFFTEAVANECMEKIFLPTIKAMQEEGCPFQGCLYFGLMLTPNGPKVIEYNCRFGDPETQAILPLLETDLLDIMLATTNGTLNDIDIKWKDGACACVVAASGGYPGKYPTGLAISGLNDDGQIDGADVFHAGTKFDGEQFLTAGGRVLSVCCVAKDVPAAQRAAYEKLSQVSFENMHFRRDIGAVAIAAINNK